MLHPKWLVPRAFHSSPPIQYPLQVSNGLTLPFVAAGRHVSPSMHLYPQRCRFGSVTANVWLRTHKRAATRGVRDTISSRRVKADSPNCWLRCVVPAAYTHVYTWIHSHGNCHPRSRWSLASTQERKRTRLNPAVYIWKCAPSLLPSFPLFRLLSS